MNNRIQSLHLSELSDRQFNKFAEFITCNLGIRMPDKKKQMLRSRLLRRLRSLELDSFDAYYNYVFNEGGLEEELQEFINVVTTNKTDFFREPKHFDYLSERAIPEICKLRHDFNHTPLTVWCAGCSSGEEPYTLAVVISEYCRSHRPINFRIIATDISTKVLKMAAQAVYKEEKIEPFTLELKKRYLLRSKDRVKKEVRFVPEIRNRIQFRQLNFMDDAFDVIPGNIDIIFFRNVMIYFDPPTQQRILEKMAAKLIPHGYLFTGHSESIKDLTLPFEPVSNAVYRRIR